ncbi:hypothetical protein BN1047_03714 [Mycolicibacterium neoaurum]|uniref:ESX-1 secretion-associated protein n=1 Tax=Mycolicibacterium neoaurum TaxID=1795 RepID=A0AAV2WNI9_MYCNE|nr:hypothetical protein BN1047_03714 [Mycolicibacterium neoaurum]
MTDQFSVQTDGVRNYAQTHSDVNSGLVGLPALDGTGVNNSHGAIAASVSTALGSALSGRGGAMGATSTSASTISDLLQQAARAYAGGDEEGGRRLRAAADALDGRPPGAGGAVAGAAGAAGAGGADAMGQMGQIMGQVGQQVGQLAQSVTAPLQGLAQGLQQVPQQIMQGVQQAVQAAAVAADASAGGLAAESQRSRMCAVPIEGRPNGVAMVGGQLPERPHEPRAVDDEVLLELVDDLRPGPGDR